MLDYNEGHLTGDFPFVPKQKRALEKRKALLESGKKLFIKKGYEQTTAKDIASEAGVAIGTFYRYFSDKRQLLMALLEDQIENIFPPEPTWCHENGEKLLASLLKDYYERINRVGLHRVLAELLPHDKELASFIQIGRKKILKKIEENLIQAKKLGLVWEDLDLSIVAWAIFSLFEKLPDKERIDNKEPDFAAIAKVISRMVVPPPYNV